MKLELEVRHRREGAPTEPGYYLVFVRLENPPTICWYGRDGFRRGGRPVAVTYFAGPLPDLGTPLT